MATASLPELLTSLDVGAWLSIPARQVEKLARNGDIPCILLPDGTLAFRAADLAAWSERLPRPGKGVPRAS